VQNEFSGRNTLKRAMLYVQWVLINPQEELKNLGLAAGKCCPGETIVRLI
jgi:hypothetical protein